MNELKPCPFCGAENKPFGNIVLIANTEYWKHWYNGCILSGFVIKDPDAWNRRTTDEG